MVNFGHFLVLFFRCWGFFCRTCQEALGPWGPGLRPPPGGFLFWTGQTLEKIAGLELIPVVLEGEEEKKRLR